MEWIDGFTVLAGIAAVSLIGHNRGLRRIKNRSKKTSQPPPKIFDETDEL